MEILDSALLAQKHIPIDKQTDLIGCFSVSNKQRLLEKLK